MRYLWDSKTFFSSLLNRLRVLMPLSLLLLPLVSRAQGISDLPMQKDHRAVLISGFATGSPEGSSMSSIFLNGVEFTSNTLLPNGNSRHELGSPFETCEGLREQIATFTLGANVIPEFEAECVALAGDAALLLIQANTEKYLVPSKEDENDEIARWLKLKRRFVFVTVNTNDETQKLKVVK